MRKSFLIGLALISLSAFSFNAPAGIFIADEENRWHIPGTDKNSEEKLGYIICEGGYLGSPLIPNEKRIVDEFLQNCANPNKRGPSKLPIIDAEANHKKSSGYKAYSVSLKGQTYYLCHGFLNSSAWCSFEAEKKAMNLTTKIRRGENIENSEENFNQIAQEPPRQTLIPEIPQELPRQALIQEITREISQTLNLNEQPTKQAIQINSAEMQALKEGKISLEQLTNSRPTISLNENNQIPFQALKAPSTSEQNFSQALSPTFPNQASNLGAKTIAITQSELAALQSGNLTMQDLLNRPSVNSPINGAQLSSLVGSGVSGRPQIQQISPMQLSSLIGSGVSGRPQIQQISPMQLSSLAIPAQMQPSFSQAQTSFQAQPSFSAQASFNQIPVGFNPQALQAIPLQPQLIYQSPQPSQGVPTTQTYSTIYGTHTNTVYWPGMPRAVWY